jgi:hypothetical protein
MFPGNKILLLFVLIVTTSGLVSAAPAPTNFWNSLTGRRSRGTRVHLQDGAPVHHPNAEEAPVQEYYQEQDHENYHDKGQSSTSSSAPTRFAHAEVDTLIQNGATTNTNSYWRRLDVSEKHRIMAALRSHTQQFPAHLSDKALYKRVAGGIDATLHQFIFSTEPRTVSSALYVLDENCRARV